MPVEQLAATMCAQMGIQQLVGSDYAVCIGSRESQINDRTPHSKGIRVSPQADLALLVRQLFGMVVQGIYVIAASDEETRNAALREIALVDEPRRKGHDGGQIAHDVQEVRHPRDFG